METPSINGHGFATPTETDHRGWLWVVSLMVMIYSVLSLIVRFTAKWKVLWYDDALLAIGFVLAAIHWGILFEAFRLGLGAYAPESPLLLQISRASTLFFASRPIDLMALYFSKLSMLAFTRKIFSGNFNHEKSVFNLAIVSTAVMGVTVVLLSSVACHPSKVLISAHETCYAFESRWTTITALDVFTEIVIVILPAYFMFKTQLATTKKLMIIFFFSFRLLVAAFTLTTNAAFRRYYRHRDSHRISIGIAPAVAWSQVLLGWSLISASIPCMRTFLGALMPEALFAIRDLEHMAYGTRLPLSNVRNGGGGGGGGRERRKESWRSDGSRGRMSGEEVGTGTWSPKRTTSNQAIDGWMRRLTRLRPDVGYKVSVQSRPEPFRGEHADDQRQSASLHESVGAEIVVRESVEISVEARDEIQQKIE